jgi:hypothetical protein
MQDFGNRGFFNFIFYFIFYFKEWMYVHFVAAGRCWLAQLKDWSSRSGLKMQ